MNNCKDNIKVSIVGCGNVGATIAYATILKGIATELSLIDIFADKAHGLMLDLEHSMSFTEACALNSSGKFEDVAGSKLIIVTAGARQKDGESRLDLAKKNREILGSMMPALVKKCVVRA